MKRSGLFASLACGSLFVLAGCGGDPLVGTWGNTTCGTGVMDATCNNAVTFGPGTAVSFTSSATNSATAAAGPGCVTTISITGVTYTSTATQIMLNGANAVGTLARTSCTDATLNAAAAPIPMFSGASLTGSNNYTISGTTLSVTDMSGTTTYTRR